MCVSDWEWKHVAWFFIQCRVKILPWWRTRPITVCSHWRLQPTSQAAGSLRKQHTHLTERLKVCSQAAVTVPLPLHTTHPFPIFKNFLLPRLVTAVSKKKQHTRKEEEKKSKSTSPTLISLRFSSCSLRSSMTCRRCRMRACSFLAVSR